MTSAPIAILFPGQGSQFAGMADPWMEHPAGAEVLDACAEAWGKDLVALSRDADALGTTEVAQPAVFAVNVAAFRVVESCGIEVGAAAGHSLGEYSALVAAGVLGLEAAFGAVVVRGRAMQEASDATPSTMSAVLGLSPEKAAELCEVAGRGDVLQVANENSPEQTVISGTVPAIERAEELAKSMGAKRAIRLQVAGAFHSPLMRSAVPAVRAAIADLEFADPRFPVVPNVSAKITEEGAALRDLLGRQVVSPVRWDRSMKAMGAWGITTFLEAGPGDVLAKLSKRCVEGSVARAVGSPEAAEAFARSWKDGDLG